MEINPEILEVLKEMKIDQDQGVLTLLGYYFNLDVDKICSEEVIKSVSMTKIIEKDYRINPHRIIWNIPLFKGQQVHFEWVKTEWLPLWNANMERKGSSADAIKRMQEWFKRYPEYRKDDVMEATKRYISLTNPKYFKNSSAFIFDGAGASKKSELLGWCEKMKNSNQSASNMAGRIMR